MPDISLHLFPERSHERIKRFLSLPEFDRTIAYLMAMNQCRCTVERILEQIKILGMVPKEKGELTKATNQLSQAMQTLQKLGWLVETYDRKMVVFQEDMPILLWLCAESDTDSATFRKLAEARRMYAESLKHRLGRYYDEETSISPLQEGYYTGHFTQPVPTRAGARGRDTRYEELQQIIGQPFDARRMRNLPTDAYDPAMLAGIEALLIKGYPVTPYLELANTGDAPLKSHVELILSCEALLLAGQIEKAEALANRHEVVKSQFFSQAVAQILGWVAFVKGDNDTAIARFEEAMEWSTKGTRKRKTCLIGHSGIFFLMALLRRGTSDDYEKVDTYAYWGVDLGGKTGFVPEAYGMLKITAAFLDGKFRAREFKRVHDNNASGIARAPLIFITALCARWAGVVTTLTDDSGESLENFAGEAVAHGFYWLASETYELLAANAGSNGWGAAAYREQAATLRDQCQSGITPLVDLIKAPEPWELSLGALEKLAGIADDKASPAPGTARLLWLVESDYHGGVGLIPYLQMPLKSGKPGTPKKALMDRLASPNLVSQFTPADRRAIELVSAGYMNWAISRRFGPEYLAALEVLAGSSNVYTDRLFRTPTKIVKLTPEISLASTPDGRLTLTLLPALSYQYSGTVVYLESSDKLVVVPIRQAHVDLKRILQTGASFPAEAKERLVASLGKLSSEISIESDSIGFEAIARQVPAQDLPEIRLMPDGTGGIVVNMSVQPIADVGEHYAPASGKPVIFARAHDNEHLQAERDLEAERVRAAAVISACAVLQCDRDESRNAWSWQVTEPDDCLELLLDLNELGDGMVKVTWPEGEPLLPPKSAHPSQFHGSVKGSGQWFEADGELRVDNDLVLTMRQIMELLEQTSPGSRFIEITKGRFIALTRQFRQQLDDLRALSSEGKGGARKLSPLAAHALADLEQTTSLKTGTAWKSQLKKIRDAANLQPKVPKTLRADLRSYQTEGYEWLARLAEWGAGACLADDMGLGKTVQALALLLHRAKGGPALVIAPTSVAANWIDEATRFAPTLDVVLYTGPDRKDRLKEIGGHTLVVTTYGILQRGDDELTAAEWHTVVLDEAQAIKNRATKRSKAAMKLRAPFRIATTGTPVENRLDELHNLFAFLNPGLLGSAERFHKQFADPIERSRDVAARDRLRRVIKPFILRRLKSDVLKDLPPKTEVTLHVELDDEESAFYEALRQKAVSDLESARNAPEENAVRILAEITRLRRACCHPKLVQPKGVPESSKQRVFVETLTEILDGGHQVLVFSQFVDHLKIARDSLEALGIDYQYLDGSTPAKKRKAAIDAFQSGEGNVFLISLKAGGSGLNLTAADYVIHLDPWWNPAVEDQASDRAHRIGQQRPVTIYRLVTKGTIEEKIVALHHEKRDLASAMLEGTDTAGRLTSEQMLELLREAGN